MMEGGGAFQSVPVHIYVWFTVLSTNSVLTSQGFCCKTRIFILAFLSNGKCERSQWRSCNCMSCSVTGSQAQTRCSNLQTLLRGLKIAPALKVSRTFCLGWSFGVTFLEKYLYLTTGWMESVVMLSSSDHQRLTCVCGWWRWRACRPSSWRWSCRSAGPGSPPPFFGTRAAASLWLSCHPTGRSPGCLKSERGDGPQVSKSGCRMSRFVSDVQLRLFWLFLSHFGQKHLVNTNRVRIHEKDSKFMQGCSVLGQLQENFFLFVCRFLPL